MDVFILLGIFFIKICFRTVNLSRNPVFNKQTKDHIILKDAKLILNNTFINSLSTSLNVF